MEKRRTECPGLPSGWTREEVTRKSGLSAGKLDIYYYSPAGKKFRSKPQLTRALDGTIDLTSFDFRTGCMIARKQKNKHKLRGEGPASNKSASQSTLHLGTTIPIRQTASIFKQQITKVTNHPDNKVKPDPQKVLEPPKQVFWEKRLQGLSASDMAQEVIKAIDLSKLLQVCSWFGPRDCPRLAYASLLASSPLRLFASSPHHYSQEGIIFEL
uniref:methyl-CpG-binding domain protein 2-like isoform X2 n=1 Tax=Myxine glutinosa TaxID=7769 RepID=UPI00358F3D27